MQYYLHVYVQEAISDPLLDAWYQTSTGNENGDLCNFNFGPISKSSTGGSYNVQFKTGKFLVQTIYSNSAPASCKIQQ